MAAGSAKKKRRRKKEDTNSVTLSESESVAKITEVKVSQDTSYNPDLTQLFTDDWDGMQAPKGMEKKGAAAAASKDKPTLPDLKNYQSQLTPITGLGPEKRRELSAAERFQEGGLIQSLKTATWFALVALVAWEVYLHSPLFKPPGTS
eukprot:5466-Heterococcus_DN1.PRE.3